MPRSSIGDEVIEKGAIRRNRLRAAHIARSPRRGLVRCMAPFLIISSPLDDPSRFEHVDFSLSTLSYSKTMSKVEVQQEGTRRQEGMRR